MAPDKSKPEEAIFKAAIQVEAPETRRAYVLEACGSDRQLLAEVEALLQYHEARSFLDAPVLDPEVRLDEPVVTEGPGTVIGRYKLLEKIGEGGMAVVYMAEQTEPIRRKVALKIIKLGMDTRQVIARFEAERQALALMDHPCIAKVLDAGSTETGRPYFVMELVQGVSITEYCDKNRLSTKERLALFLQVCQAVQHAHTKGIIHRDIKPSNVMVTHHDGQPIPKVIDFGIAKATNQKLTEKTLFTRYAHLIGTPAYMSPEQAELSDLDIDTRSDIYSLGVLLYELLTGTTPFSEEELRKAGYLEMQRIIREQEPVKPSTRLSTLAETLTDIAQCRNATPDLLRKMIRGDLDWIVMKSLEKDRVRRYETASSLAEDVRRHLESEPILTRGPSATYRLHRFLRRHRSQVLAALVVVVVTTAAAVVLSLWNRHWQQQLAEAEAFRRQAAEWQDKEILSRAQDQYAKGERQAVLETVQSIFPSPYAGPDAQLLCATILAEDGRSEEAIALLGPLVHERREIAGAAYALWARILIETQSAQAEKSAQIEEYQRQAEILLPKTAEAYFLRAMTAITIKEQLAFLDQALADPDPLNPITYESHRLRAFLYYASRKYEKMRDDALVMTALRPGDPLGYSLRARALREWGQYREAIAAYDGALTRTPKDDPRYLDLTTQRLETLLRMRSYPAAIAAAQEAVGLWPDRPIFQYDLFAAQTALGNYDAAAALFTRIIRPGPDTRRPFEDWCTKYIFDSLQAGRLWHPPDRAPVGAAFLPMAEAEEIYRRLAAKAKRVIVNGFTARWSPDGKKLAFSMGVVGYDGVALYDPATNETELLIVPGKDPAWSPDGRYIAFVRDCRALRVPEFATAGREQKQRPQVEEEVWVMKSDGTEPRLLAPGGWPSWSQDSQRVYYQSRVDNALCSISLEGRDATPKRLMACSYSFPAVAPDGQRVAYMEAGVLQVKDLATQTIVSQWPTPTSGWGFPAWSPAGNELCTGTAGQIENKMGLWVHRLDGSEPLKVLDSQITTASWTPEGTKLVFSLGAPYFEIWMADLDPNISLAQALGPARTMVEHWQDMLRFYTRRIEADPQDAYVCFDRARYHDYLHDRAMVSADMTRWSAVMSGRLPSHVSFDAGRSLRRVLKVPLVGELVFSAERPVDVISTMSVAFGQKGRWEMKLFEVPMVVTSFLGICLLSGMGTPAAHADFVCGPPTYVDIGAYYTSPSITADGLMLFGDRPVQVNWEIWTSTRATPNDNWGPPNNLGPTFNSSSMDGNPSISADGLTLFFDSLRSGGQGDRDIWVTTRPTRDGPWSQPTNLGPAINSPYYDGQANLSADGLCLYFSSTRPGGYGSRDTWVTTRESIDGAWSAPRNLGPVVNSSAYDSGPCISPDGQILFFGSARSGGYGSYDLWYTRRASTGDAWTVPVNLGPTANSPNQDFTPGISADGGALYFCSYRPGGNGLWQVPLLPIVDFNADGKVDLVDLVMLVQNWGTANTLYDIGPMPWGDGKVDIEDLKVFMTYYEKENPPAQP
jgi:serine/threonine protein kinase/Tol biopolymer transport system component/tetratricopeptide (TPR) repeat protein